MTSFNLPWPQMITCVIYGFCLSLFYLGLLWLTVKSLPKVKHKNLWLFTSAIIRLVLFLSGALLLSQNNPARFLWIVGGFIMTRLILLGLVKQKEAV